MDSMKSNVTINGRLIYEINRGNLLFALIAAIVGLAVLIVDVIFLTQSVDALKIVAVIIGGLDVIFAVFFASRIFLSMKKADRLGAYAETSFEEDHLLLHVEQTGDKKSDTKIFYKDILYYRESPHYLIVYVDKVRYLPLEKREDIIELLTEKNVQRKGKARKKQA